MKAASVWVLGGVLCVSGIAAGIYMKDKAPSAAAEDPVSSAESPAQARLVSDFSRFAGSDANARSLAAGLRHGSEIILVTPAAGEQAGTATRFLPPTGSMDYGNVRIALVLAREQLAQLGISRPTPPQIKAVLAGGGVASRVDGRAATPFLLPGVLQMRASGMGWAKIGDAMGLTLEQAMHSKGQRERVAAQPDARHLRAPGVEGGMIAVAVAKSDVEALRRAGVTPVPIASAPGAKIPAAAARTAVVTKPAAPAQRSASKESGPETRHSGANLVAASDNAANAGKVTTPSQDDARGGVVGGTAAAPRNDPVGSEDGQTTE